METNRENEISRFESSMLKLKVLSLEAQYRAYRALLDDCGHEEHGLRHELRRTMNSCIQGLIEIERKLCRLK